MIKFLKVHMRAYVKYWYLSALGIFIMIFALIISMLSTLFFNELFNGGKLLGHISSSLIFGIISSACCFFQNYEGSKEYSKGPTEKSVFTLTAISQGVSVILFSLIGYIVLYFLIIDYR